MPMNKEFNIQQQHKKDTNNVNVTSKEAYHQEPLKLPAEMKNYRKGKKQAVSTVLQRAMDCGILNTQQWHQPK